MQKSYCSLKRFVFFYANQARNIVIESVCVWGGKGGQTRAKKSFQDNHKKGQFTNHKNPYPGEGVVMRILTYLP